MMNGELTTLRLGQLIRQYRERVGLTQVELADLSTVSVRAIRNLELGLARNPRRETLRLLADALRIGGEHRAALQLAAGHEADSSTFTTTRTHASSPTPTVLGRAQEIDTLFTLVTAGLGRIIKITGIGGVGKTLLARAVAELLYVERGMPTLWACLSTRPVVGGRHHTPLVPWIEGMLTNDERSFQNMCRLIGDRAMLVILDGDDSGQLSDETLAGLTQRCPQVRILVTSRLGNTINADFHLPVLPLPVDADQSATTSVVADTGPAVQLLLAAVHRIDPHFRATVENSIQITEICRLLDGIPRALESAASWFLLSSPADLVELAHDDARMLAVPPQEAHDTSWLREAVRDGIASLSPAQFALLNVAACWDNPWTLAELTMRMRSDRLETAKAVHALLMCGLIRPQQATGDGPQRLMVLGLVRESLAANNEPGQADL